MADKQLKVKVVGDVDKARKALAKLDGSLAENESGADRLKGSLKRLAAGVSLAAIGKQAIEAGGNLEQMQATLAGLYGDAKLAKTTLSGLRDVAKDSRISFQAYGEVAETLAYAGVQGKKAVGVLDNVGDALVGAGRGSEDLDSAGDALLKMVNAGKVTLDALQQLSNAGVPILSGLAAHFNTTVEDINKMASAGKIGIEDVLAVLENATGDTFKKQIAAADQVEKSFAATWDRMSDSAKTSLGEAVLPLMKAVTPAMEKAADALGAMPAPITAAVTGLGGAVLAWSVFGDTIAKTVKTGRRWVGALVESMGRMRAGFAGAAEGASGFAGGFGRLMKTAAKSPGAWTAAAVGVGILVKHFYDADQAAKRTKANMESLIDAVNATGDSFENVFNKQLIQTLHDLKGGFDLGDEGDALRYQMDKLGISAVDLSKAVQGTDAQYDAFRKRLIEGGGLAGPMSGGAAAGAVDSLRESFQGATSTAAEMKKESKELGVEQDTLGGKTDDLAGSMKNLASVASDAKDHFEKGIAAAAGVALDAIDDLTQGIKDYADTTTSVLSSDIQVQDGIDRLTQALKENGDNWDINDEKGRSNYETLISLKDAIYDNAQALVDQGTPLDVAQMKWVGMVDQLKATMRQSGLTEDEINNLITQMGLTPNDIRTVFHSDTTDAINGARAVAGALSSIPTQVTIGISVIGQAAANIAAQAGAIAALTGGGHAWGGNLGLGWNLVGEHGPELTDGKRVIGAGRTQALLDRMPPPAPAQGATIINHVTVNVAGSVRSDRELVDVVGEELLRRQGRSATAVLPGVGR